MSKCFTIYWPWACGPQALAVAADRPCPPRPAPKPPAVPRAIAQNRAQFRPRGQSARGHDRKAHAPAATRAPKRESDASSDCAPRHYRVAWSRLSQHEARPHHCPWRARRNRVWKSAGRDWPPENQRAYLVPWALTPQALERTPERAKPRPRRDLRSGRKLGATACTARTQHIAATNRCRTRTETMATLANKVAGLESALHHKPQNQNAPKAQIAKRAAFEGNRSGSGADMLVGGLSQEIGVE